MKRHIAAVVVAAFLLMVPVAEAAPAGTCVVDPNPVDLTTMAPTNETYNVTATGGTFDPDVWYEFGLFQKGNGLRDERRVRLVQADEDGVVSADIPVYDGVTRYGLWEGTVKVEVKRYRVGGKDGPKVNERLAICYFDVIRS